MTLPRVLEPEVMDTLDDAQDYDTMDHSEVNQRFVDDLLATGTLDGEVLDLGTGTALIPVELCGRDETCRVVAVDLSVNMLDLARYRLEVAGLVGRILLDCVDAKQLPFESDRFDVVMSNSIVHHIPEPQVVLAEAVRVAAPGGALFFRDLLRPPDEATVAQLVQSYVGDATDRQQKLFADSLRAALTLDEIRALVSELGFSAETVIASSDRHWTWQARKA